MHEKRDNFWIFLLKIAEKQRKTDRGQSWRFQAELLCVPCDCSYCPAAPSELTERERERERERDLARGVSAENCAENCAAKWLAMEKVYIKCPSCVVSNRES